MKFGSHGNLNTYLDNVVNVNVSPGYDLMYFRSVVANQLQSNLILFVVMFRIWLKRKYIRTCFELHFV